MEVYIVHVIVCNTILHSCGYSTMHAQHCQQHFNPGFENQPKITVTRIKKLKKEAIPKSTQTRVVGMITNTV